VTPFELLLDVPSGTVSTRARLDALDRAQQAIARDPDVASVIGPGALAGQALSLEQAQQTVADSQKTLSSSAADVGALRTSLGQAAAGAARVQAGFGEATSAVESLARGASGGDAAVSRLSAGLQQAAAGSRLTNAGLLQADGAANRIVSGGRAAAAGADRLTSELGSGNAFAIRAGPRLVSLATVLNADAASLGGLAGSIGAFDAGPSAASARLATASRDLADMRIGRLDRRYAAVTSAIQAAQTALASTPSAVTFANRLSQLYASEHQIGSQLETTATAIGQLSQAANHLGVSARSLRAGVGTLEKGQEALAVGIDRLAISGTALTRGLGALSAGTQTLGSRIGALQSGAAALASGVTGEQRQTAGMAAALGSGERSVASAGRKSPSQSGLLDELSHSRAFFSSGYLVLAALEGAPPGKRGALDYTINVSRNGQAARMLIVPRSAAQAAATRRLRRRLERVARQLAGATGGQAVLGGPAAQLRDYATAAAGRMPLLSAVLMIATFVLLVGVFRSLFASLVGVLLNLLSVAAAFGALSLLAGGHHPPIGGPGYVDSLSVSAMFAAVFALSIDYQVFLLMRMREGWLRTDSVSEGVEYGISHTARVVVGAAAIMAGVFLAFASADVATIRELGIGLAIAIAIDSTVVRLVLLPSALRLGGRFTWWLPRWLDKCLPTVDIGAERRRADRPRPGPTICGAPISTSAVNGLASTLPGCSGGGVLVK
jgi:RND superfamily putative drug exporter